VAEPAPVPPEAGWPRVRGYELLSVIGSGGMGIVYKARHLDLQRTVALKTLRGTAGTDPEFRDRFRDEAEAVARLQHPNIIQVFEIGTVEPLPGEREPSPFISLEFVEGGSLVGHVATPQPPRCAARMVEKLARAVQAAHRLGVVHRDLKPANVLLTADGEPKVADFGLAKQLGPERDCRGRFVTQAGIVRGTPEYMAPEQVSGEPPGPAIDVWALGVILYELLTARVPFRGEDPAETMYLVRHEDPVSPRRLQPGLPRDLETICLKCMEKSPAQRYESAEALADDLARWADGLTIRARPAGPVERAARWAWRNPAVAALSAAVVLVALAGLSGVVWKWREAQLHADAAEAAAALAGEHARAERWERYRANLVAAASALEVHNVGAARRALDDAPPEFRNWEWHHFRTRLDAARQVLRWDGAVGNAAAVTPDGGTVALVSPDGQVRVWDAVGRQEVRTFRNARALKIGAALGPDGKTFAYEADEHAIALLDVAAGRVRAVLRGHDRPVVSLHFSGDGTRLASASEDRTIRVWDTETGRLLRTLGGFEATTVILAVSGDGRRLASADPAGNGIDAWDVETGLRIRSCVHEHNGVGAKFSPRGDRLVTVEPYPGNVLRLWDLATDHPPVVMPGHLNQVQCLAYSPDGTRIASCSMDKTVRLWDGQTGGPVAVLDGHRGWVVHAAFSPDSTRLVSAAQDHTVRVWDAGTGAALAVLDGHSDEVILAAYLPDGKSIVSAARDGTVRLWDGERVEGNHTLRGHTSFVYDVACHPDGERVASAAWDGTVRLWDASTGLQTAVLEHGDKVIVPAVAFHPAGRLLATLARDGKVRLWDVATGRQVHAWPVPTENWRDSRLAFSPRGDLLAAGDRDGAVHLWDVGSKAEVAVLRGHRAVVRDVAFSPDGRWLASASDNDEHVVRVWDVATREPVRTLEGHVFAVNALAWSGDGSLLASGSSDGTARLWDATTWQEAAVLKHGTNVYGVAFTPDGTRLASACADNTIRFWDVTTRQEVGELRGHRDYVHALAFSPDGTRLVSASGDFTVRVWDTVPPQDRGGRK
jgi:WD40 repeat protein